MNTVVQHKIPASVKLIADNINNFDNISGLPSEAKSYWSKGLTFSNNAETIFFAGCGYQFFDNLEINMSILRLLDKSKIELEIPLNFLLRKSKFNLNPIRIIGNLTIKKNSPPLVNSVTILQKLGFNFNYMGSQEPCCGGPLLFSGFEKAFMHKAENNHKIFESNHIKQIISIVPSCTYTLKNLYPKYLENFKINVTHFLQVVAQKISNLKLKLPRKIDVTYHDPCQLSRFLSITEEPRLILKSIGNLNYIEAGRTSGSMSTCCGGGGGFEAIFPEVSETLAINRVKELLDTGAQFIVTNCPGCILQLSHAVKLLKVKNIKVIDISEIIIKAMEYQNG